MNFGKRANKYLTNFIGSPYRNLYIGLALFALLIYMPLIVRGGLIYDDWSVAKLSKDCPGIGSSIACFWPGYPDRPLASIYYSLISNIFGSWSPGYLLLVVTQWLIGVSLLFRIFKKRFGVLFAGVFFVVASTPSISSTIIFSPAMQGIGTIAFLFWACSFYLLDIFIDSGKRSKLVISFILMLSSLMLYESSLPLFALSALWPLVVAKEKKLNMFYLKNYLKSYGLPIVGILLLIVFYQHFIVQHFYDYISKVRFSDGHVHIFSFGMRVIFNTVYIVTVSVINMCAWALLRLRHAGPMVQLTFVAVGILIHRLRKLQFNRKQEVKGRSLLLFLVAVGGTLAGVAVLHFVALLPPTVVGYNNRGSVGASISIAILVAIIWQRYLTKHKALALLGVIFVSLYSLTFVLQRTNYIEGQKQRLDIQAHVIPAVEKVNEPAMVVLADVPTYTSKNFNNETVFSDEVLDWGNFLFVKTRVQSIRGISLSPGRIERKEVSVKDDMLEVKTLPPIPLRLVWYYDVKAKQLIKVTDVAHLQVILKKVSTKPSFQYPEAIDARGRQAIRGWLLSY